MAAILLASELSSGVYWAVGLFAVCSGHFLLGAAMALQRHMKGGAV